MSKSQRIIAETPKYSFHSFRRWQQMGQTLEQKSTGYGQISPPSTGEVGFIRTQRVFCL